MPELVLNPLRWWRAFLRLPNEGVVKILGMALLVSAACAIAVSFAAVVLKPLREANQRESQAATMLETLRSLPGMGVLLDGVDVDRLEQWVVELDSGEVRRNVEPPPLGESAVDPSATVAVPPALDVARIARRPKLRSVYVVLKGGRPVVVVLPVYGRGYQSMLYGYLVLERDLQTVAALAFYEHGETPGIGSRITDPIWLSTFRGRRVLSDDGRFVLEITEGPPSGSHQVDGISGATRSTSGVENLLRYWVGPHGFGPLLSRWRRADEP